jgi:hypothetical protein
LTDVAALLHLLSCAKMPLQKRQQARKQLRKRTTENK